MYKKYTGKTGCLDSTYAADIEEAGTVITEMKAGHLKDIDKPSEPFEVIGKIIPRV